MNILHIDSSITGHASASRELTAAIVTSLKDGNGDAEVTYRDLAAEPLSHLTLPAFGEADSAEALAEFKAADTVVIGAPMYNFTIPSQLKAWIDRILVAGETFRYTETGAVEGLSGGKRVIVAIARGGLYGEDSEQRSVEHAERYLTSVLGFIGITDPVFVIAEGLKISEDAAKAAMAKAHDHVNELLATA
ncbi:MAG: FMN-dependent NADH-azoreductase [Citromicrobium sp.]|nr:FMN-dependent NADH-azoreductase [Citromicrobium sp.]MAO95873.1 FMN-dependent NADH-azoreductase [Citromicrobium sp.]MBD76343.1 FMN-dependent NADH-azoreductase [Citromicrobium sp.]|tara:strand:- start:6146 stop:6718 length:573 start_codon:yes stop_codon:yes gene_type:complete